MAQQVSVRGAAVAELAPPWWVRLLRLALAASAGIVGAGAVFWLGGWERVIEGLAGSRALWGLMGASCGLATGWGAMHASPLRALLGLRPASNGRGLVVSGAREAWRPLVALALLTGFAGVLALAGRHAMRSWPLPRKLSRARIEVTPPRPTENLMPIYFWDYASWLDPAQLEHMTVVVPYEKGPPEKLLSRIVFEDAHSRAVVLELSGKRPRSYPQAQVQDAFDSPLPRPGDWPLLLHLAREAGFNAGPGSQRLHELSLIALDQGSSNVTRAIGVPWGRGARAGHLFFWGPDGSVFQARCPSPCELSRLLELVQFPSDPKGSQADRLEWTAATLRKLIASPPPLSEGPRARRRHETLLSAYLTSMLSIDPRDPEAYFHLGKLAGNRETLLAAIRYGRDLGLAPAKLAELQELAERLSFLH